MTGERPADIGRAAEDLALAHLQAAGLKLRERNFRRRRGEIDLVMQDGDEIAFVEVRARRPGQFGDGVESITRGKRSRLVAAAAGWLQRQQGEPATRFDVVAVSPDGNIEWIVDAFRADD